MLSGNMSIVNDYIMFRLLMDDADKQKHKRNSLQPRNGFMMPRGSIGSENEPFCSPMMPHVPIRERLSRRGTSADVSEDASAYACYAPRRRRMSLLQTLRQQNKALADSGCDLNHQRTDSESTNRDTCSPPQKTSPTATPHKKSFSNLKTKIFGKKEKPTKVYNNGEYSQSCDVINGRSRKSPSTTNDSGRGSQGHLEERIETLAIVEREDEPEEPQKPTTTRRRVRHNSCPDLASLRFGVVRAARKNAAPIADSESDEDALDKFERNSSPISAADCLLERRMHRKFEEQRRQQIAMRHIEEEDVVDDVISRASAMSQRTTQTENLADFEDNASSIILDHFLSSTQLHLDDDDVQSTDFSLTDGDDGEQPCVSSSTNTATSVQTDLSLLNVEEQLCEFLERCYHGELEHEGMNFIAKHFFEYQSFMNMPHKAVHLHKVPASQAGTDPSMGWAPKNMLKAGKNQPAPAARANRVHRDPRPNGTKFGRPGKHENRAWGERHGELKDEKVAPHKDAWTKFLSNEDPGQRTAFECDFEDRVLATEEETLPERISRTTPDSLHLNSMFAASKNMSNNVCELLTILTYAPSVQFVTVTVKKAKCLPFNNGPFARVMLFDGRRLLEQKQTTINPSLLHKSSTDGSKPSSSSVCSSASSSSAVCDATFSESFLFHVPPTKLDQTHIVIEMYDHDEESRVQKVGHCTIGRLTDGSGNAHWIQMVRQHGLPVCIWHKMGP